MAYRIAQLPMTLSESEGYFCTFFIECFNSVCLNVNWTWLVIWTLLWNVKDFSRSQAVTYAGKVVISRKRCWIEM